MTTSVRAVAPPADTSPSPCDPVVADDVDREAKEAQALDRLAPHERRMLADATREHERIESAEAGGHRGDAGAQTVQVDVERESGAGVAVARRRDHGPHVGASGERGEARVVLERGGHLALGQRPRSSSHSSSPGSTLPERVAITRPSSGVNPIVVSTERPAAIAHREAPAPRWQLTMRVPASALTSRSSGARRATHPWESPWKP